MFFCINQHDAFFSLYSVNVAYFIDSFSIVEPSLHSRNASHLVMAYNLFDMLLFLFASVFLRIFASTFLKDTGL